MNPASNLILVGPMGAGKTSIGRRLACQLGLAFVDADHLLEERTGATVALVFELEGEAGFRRREQELLRELCAGRDQLIATGGGAVLDPATRGLMGRSGFVVHLHASVRQQLARLDRDRVRPLLAAPDRRERLHALARVRDPLYAEVADLRFDSDGLAVSVAAERLRVLLDAHWQRGDEGGGPRADDMHVA
jgi:shikimate kinase